MDNTEFNTHSERLTVKKIQEIVNQNKLVCISEYSAIMVDIIDQYVDVILVGDSLANVIYGKKNTLSIELNTMIKHAKAVVEATTRSFIVVDMPYGSYELSKEQAYKNAVRIIKETGAQAVKLEGGVYIADTVEFLNERGICVFGHIGLLPQHINQLGSYKPFGKEDAKRGTHMLLNDLQSLNKAGAFAVIIESTMRKIVDDVIKKSSVITIGIGASEKCDGQILVLADLLGLTKNIPKFVGKYMNMREQIEDAIEGFSNDVRRSEFPTSDHFYE